MPRAPPTPRLSSSTPNRETREDSTTLATNEAAGNGDFLVTLAGINRGRAANDATRMLAEVVKAVTETGNKGKVTVTIEVGKFKGGDGNVEVKASVTSTVPQPKHAAVFFFDDEFHLTRDDPSMDPMFGRSEVAGGGRA